MVFKLKIHHVQRFLHPSWLSENTCAISVPAGFSTISSPLETTGLNQESFLTDLLYASTFNTRIQTEKGAHAPFSCLLLFPSYAQSVKPRDFVSVEGIEPSTNGLKGRCSAIELHARLRMPILSRSSLRVNQLY